MSKRIKFAKLFKFLFTLAAFAAVLFYLSFLGVKFGSSSMPTGFTITPDTKMDPNSELAKYITQEEIDDFGFRCAHIVFATRRKTLRSCL